MNVLFFGGTGFFGNSLRNYCKTANEKKIIKIKYSGNKETYKNLNKNELIKPQNLNRIKKNFYNTIIHAAHPSTNRGNLNENIRYSIGVKNTIKALLLSKNKKIKNFIYVSSGIVYDNIKVNIDEEEKISEIGNEKNYKNSKIISENICKIFCDINNINLTILRCFAFSGPLQLNNKNYAIPNIIRQFKSSIHKEVKINGSGKDLRSFMNQKDLGKSLFKILISKKKYKIYNIGSNEKISIFGLANKIKKILRSKKKIIIERPKSNFVNYVPSIKRLKKIGISEIITLDQTIKEMLDLK